MFMPDSVVSADSSFHIPGKSSQAKPYTDFNQLIPIPTENSVIPLWSRFFHSLPFET